MNKEAEPTVPLSQYDELIQKTFNLALDYSNVVVALGISAPFNRHDVLARARACKAAYDSVREGVR